MTDIDNIPDLDRADNPIRPCFWGKIPLRDTRLPGKAAPARSAGLIAERLGGDSR